MLRPQTTTKNFTGHTDNDKKSCPCEDASFLLSHILAFLPMSITIYWITKWKVLLFACFFFSIILAILALT